MKQPYLHTCTLYIIFYSIFTFSLQAQIFPYVDPELDFDELNWYQLIIDSTAIGIDGKDGHGDYFNWHKIPIVETENSIFTLSTKTDYGVSGGLVTKHNKETGIAIWAKPFDRRTNERHEYPVTQFIGHDGFLNVISYETIEIFPDDYVAFILQQPPSYWKMRKYDMVTGELIKTILFDHEHLILDPNINYSSFFKLPNGYMMLHRSKALGTPYYKIHRFDKNHLFINSDSISLNLPSKGFGQDYPKVIQHSNGFTTFDIKYGSTKDERFYNVNFWDEDFNWKDSLSENTIIDIFKFAPLYYELEYADESKFLIRLNADKFSEKEVTVMMISNTGQLLQTITIPHSKGLKRDFYSIAMGKEMACPVISKLDKTNGYHITTMYSTCDSLVKHLTFYPKGLNVVASGVFSHVLNNGDILLSSKQVKDTLIEGSNLGWRHQGELFISIDASNLKTLVSTDERSSTNHQDILLYPNPVQDKLYLPKGINIAHTDIYHTNGKWIKRTFNEYVLDVHELITGTYFIRIITKDGKTHIKKFIKV